MKSTNAKKIAITISGRNFERINKLISNYTTREGKNFSISGSINYILLLGFKKFEKNNKIRFEDLEINPEVEDQDK